MTGGRKDQSGAWWIVGAVTGLHLAVLGWATYGAHRLPPRKTEINIELGVNQPSAGGGGLAAPATPSAPAAVPPQPPVPRPAERKPQPSRPVREADPTPTATAAPPPAAPSPAPATAPTAPAQTTSQTTAQISAPSAPAAATGPGLPSGATGSGAAATGTDQPVGYLNNPKPPYPRMAILQGIEGTVRLQVLVQADGTASQVLLAQSSGSELLDKSALETVARWRFTPARSQGADKAQWVGVPITFSLNRR